MTNRIQTYYSYQSPARAEKVNKKRHRRIFTLACIMLMLVATGASTIVNSVKAAPKTPKVANAVTSVAPPSKEVQKLQSTWQSTLVNQPGDVAIAVYDSKTGQTAAYSTTPKEFDTASIVKVSILEDALVDDQQQDQGLTDTEMGLATPMIENSDNDSATALWDSVGGTNSINHLYSLLGMSQSSAGTDDDWGLTQTTAKDQLAVVNTYAYSNKILNDASRATINRLLDDVESDQTWGVSAGLPNDVSYELKDGWLEDSETDDAYSNTNGWIINSIGHVHGEGQDYTIAVLTMGDPTEGYGINAVERLAALTWKTISSL